MNLCFRSKTRLQMFLLVSSSYVGVPQRDSNMASPTKLCKCIVWDEIFVGVYFCGLAIFLCFCASSWFFAIRKLWFFLLGINFRDFQKLPDPALIKFSFLLSTFVRATELNTPNNTQGVSILCKTSNKLYTVLFLKERDKVVIEQKQNLGIVFLCSEFMSENIYSGVNFCGEMFALIVLFVGTFFAERWKNCKNRKQKLEPVPHGIWKGNLFCQKWYMHV